MKSKVESEESVHYYTSLLLQTPNTDHCSPLSNQNRQFSLETDFELTDLQATQSPYFRSAQQAVLLEWLTKRICWPHKVHIFVQRSKLFYWNDWQTYLQATQGPHFRSAQRGYIDYRSWWTRCYIYYRSEWTRGHIDYRIEWTRGYIYYTEEWVNARLHLLHWGVGEREATFITLRSGWTRGYIYYTEEWVNARRTALIQSPRGDLHFYGGRFHRNHGNVSIVLLSLKENFN